MNKSERIKRVNTFIRVIADTGRRFFYSRKFDRYGHFFLGHDGHLRWRDEYTHKAIYLSGLENWDRGFSNGGTLKSLIQLLAKFIRTGEPLPQWCFRLDGPWGYGDDMQIVCDASKFAIKGPKGSDNAD